MNKLKKEDLQIAYLISGGIIGFSACFTAPFFSLFGSIFGIIGGYTIFSVIINDDKIRSLILLAINVLIFVLTSMIPNQKINKISIYVDMKDFPIIGFLSIINILICFLLILFCVFKFLFKGKIK